MTLDLCIVNFLCVTNKAWHHVSVNMDVIVSIYQVIKIKHLCEYSGLQYYTFLLLQGFHTVYPLRRWTSALSLLTIPACSKCRPKIFFFDPRLAWLFGSLPSQYKVGVFFKDFLGVWLLCEEDLWLYKIYKDLMRCCSYETQYCSTPWSLSVTLSYCPWLLKDSWCTDSKLQRVLRQTDHLYLTGCFQNWICIPLFFYRKCIYN